MNLFKRGKASNQQPVPSDADPYGPGDTIAQQYRVLAVLGKGGFGTVYLVEHVDHGSLYALKLMRSMEDDLRTAFRKEALYWVGLAPHPCVLSVRLADEVNGRPFILSEYVPEDSRGVNSLAGYAKRPQGLEKTLNLFVQVCEGMIWTYDHGLVAHRDLKPENIMISEGSLAKVADFGIAITRESDSSFWSKFGVAGTRFFMAPEQLTSPIHCDERSDIYSFGVTMNVVLSASTDADTVAPASLSRISARCTEEAPSRRYQSFAELSEALKDFASESGLKVFKAIPAREELEAWEWCNRGTSYLNLGRHSKALECYNKCLELASEEATAWQGLGRTFAAIGDHEEALKCYKKSLEAQPYSVETLAAQATSLRLLGRLPEARQSLNRALAMTPGDVMLLTNKANLDTTAGHVQAAIDSYNLAIAADDSFANAWFCKGTYLDDLGHTKEALECLDKAVELNPLDSNSWDNRGVVLQKAGKKKEALASFDRAIVCNPDNGLALTNKAMCLTTFALRTSYFEEATRCAVMAINRDQESAAAWFAYGRAHDGLGHNYEAIQGYLAFLHWSEPEMAEQLAWAQGRLAKIS